MPPSTRCVYKEQNVRCPRQGKGSPCLCDPHRVILESDTDYSGFDRLGKVLGKMFRGDRVPKREARQAVVDGIGFLAGVANAYVQEQYVQRPRTGAATPPKNFVDWAYEQLKQREREQEARRRGGGARDPAELQRLRRAARVILGWAADQAITVELVNKRRRDLAKKFHPDRQGGSVEKMQEINAAADVLLAELEDA
jgi:curved DNA-binding protein CbpA